MGATAAGWEIAELVGPGALTRPISGKVEKWLRKQGADQQIEVDRGLGRGVRNEGEVAGMVGGDRRWREDFAPTSQRLFPTQTLWGNRRSRSLRERFRRRSTAEQRRLLALSGENQVEHLPRQLFRLCR